MVLRELAISVLGQGQLALEFLSHKMCSPIIDFLSVLVVIIITALLIKFS